MSDSGTSKHPGKRIPVASNSKLNQPEGGGIIIVGGLAPKPVTEPKPESGDGSGVVRLLS